ncbi:MAG: nuclear transport factor 2 family protein [Microthrixaceae bacterium]
MADPDTPPPGSPLPDAVPADAAPPPASTPATTPRVDPADRAEAAELLARYAEAIDAGDFDAVGDLLDDAVLEDADGSPIAAGRDQIAALYAATTLRYDDGTPLTAHVITNVIVDARGPDELEMRSRFTVLQATPELPLQPIVVGRYVDTLRRLDGRWRFTRRVMAPQAWGDVSQHLGFDPR